MKNLDEPNYKELSELLEDFFAEYAKKDGSMTDAEFLKKMFSDRLPKASEENIDGMCQEILTSNRNMKTFLDEAKTSPGYENATQNWFCEKIKLAMDDGDYDFIRELCIQNEILDTINNSSIQLSKDFQNADFAHHFGKKDDIFDGGMLFKEHHAEHAEPQTKQNVHRAAIDTGVKRSLMTQYKKMMQLDFSNLTVRSDMTNVAANLSRNAAMTGICGMALTTGLSLIFKSSVTKQSLLKIIVKTGTTDSMRVLVTGALKVGAERRILPLLTRATPMITLTAVALIAVESSKTLVQYVNGDIKCLEALNQVSKVSTSAICAVLFGIQGALVGATAFAAIPVAAPAVGAFMGELVGTMAGYEVGRISHANLKTLLRNVENILTANYGILDLLTNETVLLRNKIGKKVRNELSNSF